MRVLLIDSSRCIDGDVAVIHRLDEFGRTVVDHFAGVTARDRGYKMLSVTPCALPSPRRAPEFSAPTLRFEVSRHESPHRSGFGPAK
jgi:hypothetical protein